VSRAIATKLYAFTIEHVQRALDAICQQVSVLMRAGEDELLQPTLFALPDKEDIRSPKAKCVAYDRTTGKIVRYDGSSWTDLT